MNVSLFAWLRTRATAAPLRWRLTLVTVSVLAVILTLFGIIIYKTVETTILDTTANGLLVSARPAVTSRLRARALQTGTPVAATPGAAVVEPAQTATVVTGQADQRVPVTPDSPAGKSLADLAKILTTRNTAARTTDINGRTLGDGPALAEQTGVVAPLLAPALYREVAETGDARHLRVQTDNGPMVVELVPLFPNNDETQPAIGVLELTTSLGSGDALLDRVRLLLSFGTLIAVAAGVLLTLPLVRGALSPIRRLALTSRRIAAGDLGQRVEVPPSGDALAELAEDFNEMVSRLEAAIALQRSFIADASHELRTPLTALSGGVEMLQLGVDRADPEARARLLRLMGGEIARMGRLVDDLLTLTHLDADPEHSLQLAPVDLGALAAQVVDETRLLAPDRNVVLELAPGASVLVQGDADKLRQVLLNLCANARGHTPADGTITIGVRRERTRARVTVADTGVGIPPDALARVWDRFFRVDKARERRTSQGGLGLGLAIVRAIVEAHGGAVAIASTVGQGTTVTLHLPLVPRATSVRSPATGAATAPSGTRSGGPRPGHVPGA
jgi:two-component system, OmpR family, sensor kinase